jgi:hypothetical protein
MKEKETAELLIDMVILVMALMLILIKCSTV